MAENTTNSNNDTHYFNDMQFRGIQEMIRESLLTDPTNGMYVVDELSNAVHNGNAFAVNASGTITTGASVYLLGKTGDKEVHFDHFHISVSKGLFAIDLYENPTITADGTPIVALNRKRNSANTPTMSTFSGSTITDNGTLLEEIIIYDTGGVGSNEQQGSGNVDADWILAPNTNYLFVLKNNDSTSTNFSGHFIWAERDVI